MKKKSVELINAAKHKVNNPSESIMSIANKFGVDRGALTRTLSEYELYTINGNDGYMYYFEDNELELVNYFIGHPHIKILELKRLFNSNIKK